MDAYSGLVNVNREEEVVILHSLPKTIIIQAVIKAVSQKLVLLLWFDPPIHRPGGYAKTR